MVVILPVVLILLSPAKTVVCVSIGDKEVTFFLDESDASPMFRGFIENLEIEGQSKLLAVRALDVLGYLTGLDRACYNFR